MSDWVETLPALWDHVWRTLEQAARDADHAWHTGALATAGLSGGAEARMIVLRGADGPDAMLEVQTDRASRKIDELEADPQATLLFWDARQSLQVRARVRIDVATGASVEAEWQALSENAARNYGGQPPPSTPMADAQDYRETAERDRFAVLRAQVLSCDVLHLGEMHRRALYERGDGFAGTWLAP